MRAISTINVETACVLHWDKGTWSWHSTEGESSSLTAGPAARFLIENRLFCRVVVRREREGGGGGGFEGLWMKMDIKGLHGRSKQFEAVVTKMLRNNEPRRDFLVLIKKKRLCGMILALQILLKNGSTVILIAQFTKTFLLTTLVAYNYVI